MTNFAIVETDKLCHVSSMEGMEELFVIGKGQTEAFTLEEIKNRYSKVLRVPIKK